MISDFCSTIIMAKRVNDNDLTHFYTQIAGLFSAQQWVKKDEPSQWVKITQ